MKTQFADVADFLQEVQVLDNLKADYIVPQGKMAMVGDETMNVRGLGDFPIQQIAHEQIAARLGIPAAYYKKMAEIPGLRAENVNSWLKKEPTANRLLRTLDGQARAYLSDRYRPLDNLLIVGAAMPVLAANPDLHVRSAVITPARLYLQVSFPKIATEIRVGDVVEFGFTLTTSEVGRGKVDVQKWFHQLRCSNGYVGESIFSQRHLGRKIGEDEEDYMLFGDDTIEAEMKSFQLQLRDLLAATINRDGFEKEIEKFRVANGDKFVHTEAEQIIKNVTKKYAFYDDEMKAILNRVMAESQLSRLVIADAVTNQVHFTESADRGYDLEKAGYDLIAMPSVEWKKLVA